MFNFIQDQIANVTIKVSNLFSRKQSRKTFVTAPVQNSSIVKRAGFDQSTLTLRIWFRNGSCADFHGANWQQFEWLVDPLCDVDEAFEEVRDRLSFFTQVPNPADAHYTEYFTVNAASGWVF